MSVIFALLDLDPDSESIAGSTNLIESRSNWDPDPQPCLWVHIHIHLADLDLEPYWEYGPGSKDIEIDQKFFTLDAALLAKVVSHF